MESMETLKKLYQDYDAEAVRVKKETKGPGGIWGMGEDPRAHPCHDAFYHAVGSWVTDFISGRPESPLVMDAAKFILGAAAERRERESFWYTFAAQGHVKPMIAWMSGQECKTLADWYDTQYSKLERLPMQREVYKMLRKSARGK